VAAGIKISTFDLVELEGLLTGPFGLNLSVAVAEEEQRHKAQLALDSHAQQNFPRLHSYMQYEFWNLEPYRNLQNLLWLLRSLGPNLRDSVDQDRHLFCRIVFLVSLATVELSGIVLATSQGDPERGFAVAMFGGARERREREVLFDQVHKLTGTKEPASTSFEPEYFSQLRELVVRMVRSARSAALVPSFLEAAADLYFRSVGSADPAKCDTVARKIAQDLCILATKEAKSTASLAKEILAV